MENLYKTEYLGDGVYISYDGFGYELRANDHLNPTDRIYLEPEVLKALDLFRQRHEENKLSSTK